MATQFVDLSKSISKMRDLLAEDLALHAGDIPLERFTTEGGWPDTDTLQVEVDGFEIVDGKVRVRVDLWFDEIVPTGCADIKRNEDCHESLDLWLDPAVKDSYFKWSSEWDC